jgi:hypothetical protein
MGPKKIDALLGNAPRRASPFGLGHGGFDLRRAVLILQPLGAHHAKYGKELLAIVAARG